MYRTGTLHDIWALNFFLRNFSTGDPEDDALKEDAREMQRMRGRPILTKPGIVTGYIEFDPKTGEFTTYNLPKGTDDTPAG
ncbi:MAG: hypothetical protein ABH837_03500 [bacterium]